MTDRRRLIGGVVIATVIVIGVLAAANTRRPARTQDPSPEPSAVASIGDAASGTPGVATSGHDATPDASEAEPTTIPEVTAEPTPRALATGDRRLAYAEFLLRANDDRATVDTMNAALRAGVDDQDRDAVRAASDDILEFVDAEREWLRDHPPAACYEDAHGAGDAMLVAYGTTADRFLAWTKAAPGFDSLAALARALEAAGQASDALAAFGRALEATTCQ
jgi:hypothetical protein